MATITPKEITRQILNFCHSIVPDQDPFYVPVQPLACNKIRECYQNVNNVTSIYGGERILGRNIWIRPNILIEAEAHAIWKDKDGTYIDVTPHEEGETSILFLPDYSMKYEGKVICTIRVPLTNSPLVADYIDACSELDQIFANSTGPTVEVPADLYQYKTAVEKIFRTKVGPNDLCPCRSGLKHKKCCGKPL